MTVSIIEEKYSQLCEDIREFQLGATHDEQGQPLTYCGKAMEQIRGKLIG